MEALLDLAAGKLSAPWKTHSGGERQRAAIACALIAASLCEAGDSRNYVGGIEMLSDPSSRGAARVVTEIPNCILLLDEPTAALDQASSRLVEKVIVDSGLTIIMITHDEQQACRLAHQRVLLGVNGLDGI
jgi:ATPase subunit of ABC transporter with duplicated ATPase domains